MKITKLAIAFLSLFATSGAAWAQGPPGSLAAQDQSRGHLLTRHGMSATIGVGTTGFISQSARDLMAGDVGAYADLRLTYGTRSFLGVEAAYNLSGRSLSTAQFGEDQPSIFGSSLEGLARLNYPMSSGRWSFSPFLVGGLGWTAFVRTDEREVANRRDPQLVVRSTDHVGTIPMGIGFAASYNVLYLEVRGMYRPTYGEDGIGGASGTGTNMQAWFAGIAGGLEF